MASTPIGVQFYIEANRAAEAGRKAPEGTLCKRSCGPSRGKGTRASGAPQKVNATHPSEIQVSSFGRQASAETGGGGEEEDPIRP